MSGLELKDFKVKINEKYLVDIPSFNFRKGYVYTIFGKSGVGKSTFLKAMGSLIRYEGALYLNGENLVEKHQLEDIRKKVHYIRQIPEFIPGSVMKNFEYIFGFRSNRLLCLDKKILEELLTIFGLSGDILEKDVKNLSGGERQRISIIRSLMLKPEFILLDEPTSALDIHTESLFLNFLNKIKNDIGIIIVSHSLNIIVNSDKKLFFEDGKCQEVNGNIDHDMIKDMIGA